MKIVKNFSWFRVALVPYLSFQLYQLQKFWELQIRMQSIKLKESPNFREVIEKLWHKNQQKTILSIYVV